MIKMKISNYKKLAACYLLAINTACSMYHASPLPTHPDFLVASADITVRYPKNTKQQIHTITLLHGLDITDIAMLTAENNPDLKLARDDAGIAHAEAFGAGLLPEPQLTFSRDFPTSYANGQTSAFVHGVDFEITSLLKLPFSSTIRRNDDRKTDLNLLWQEIQTISQAELLFIRIINEEKQLAAMKRYQTAFNDQPAIMEMALAHHMILLDTAAGVLSPINDTQGKINDMQQQLLKDRADLNTMLHIDPTVLLPLDDTITLTKIDDAAIHKKLATIAARRPDLLALQAGYKAEDARYRSAILGQFPGVTAGINKARDNSDIRSSGFSFVITLPIFNRNQGAIAVELATRTKLHDEYQARLNQTHSDILRLLSQNHNLQQQYREAMAQCKIWQEAAENAAAAYRAHNITSTSYISLQSVYLARQLEVIILEQTLQEQQVTMRTLLSNDLSMD